MGIRAAQPLQTNTRGRLWLTKMSLQVSDSNKLTGFYHSNREQQRRSGSQFVGPDGRELNEGPFLTYGATWQTVKSNSLVMSLTAGHFHRHSITYALPVYDGYGPTAVKTIDLTTQFQTGDARNDTQFITHGNDDVAGNVRYFKPNLAGNHQIKGGFDHVRSWYSQDFSSQPSGNYVLQYQSGNAVLDSDVQLSGAAGELSELSRRVCHGQLERQQSFEPCPRHSLGERQSLRAGAVLAEHRFQREPVLRQGSAADLEIRRFPGSISRTTSGATGGPSSRVDGDATWRMARSRSDLLVAARNNRQVTTWLWHDNNGDRLYQQGEVNLDPAGSDFQSISGVTNGVVNPDMPQPKYDQFILGYEREVFRNWNVRGTGIYSRNFDLRRTETINIPYAAYNVAITNPDPGFDGRPGTSDDPGKSITYYEYPTTLSGISNQSTRQVGWPGQQTYKTIELPPRGGSREAGSSIRRGWRRRSTSHSPTDRR